MVSCTPAHPGFRIEQFTTVVDGCKVFVQRLHNPRRRSGHPLLVFLHDALGCVDLWHNFPQALCEHAACDGLVFDRPGHGRSDPLPRAGVDPSYLADISWRQLPKWFALWGVRKPVLVGHSDGGTIALLYAARYPNAVSGLVCEASHVFVEEITRRGIRTMVARFRQGGLARQLRRYHGGKADRLFDRWKHTWLSPAFASWDITGLLGRIVCPVLAIQGEKDEYGSMAQLEAITAGVTGPADALRVPDCGHFPHRRSRRRVLSETTRFLAQVGSHHRPLPRP